MAEKKGGRKAAGKAGAGGGKGFTPEERAAMRERAREAKAEARRATSRVEGERAVRAKLAAMPPADRAMGERIHGIVAEVAPALAPRAWYGMPAWGRDGEVVCFFQSARMFKARYATFGFTDKARLDEGWMWPTSFALTGMSGEEEARIAALVRRAVG